MQHAELVDEEHVIAVDQRPTGRRYRSGAAVIAQPACARRPASARRAVPAAASSDMRRQERHAEPAAPDRRPDRVARAAADAAHASAASAPPSSASRS